MELLEVYDENHKVTKEFLVRGNKNLKENRYVGIILIFIKNSENKFLIQKTSKEKGSVFATTGGLITKGDNSIDTVIKEVKEELGLIIEKSDFKFFKTYKREHTFTDVYYMEKNIDIKVLTLQKEEVEYVKWLDISEINNLIDNDLFRKGNIIPFKELLSNLKN